MEYPPYTGYRPRSMRFGRASSSGDAQKSGKRNRLGKRLEKAIYKVPRVARMFPVKYAQLCERSDNLVGIRR